MEQPQFTPITGQPDPETFRRVWARVMEGQTDSPIQLSGPAPGEEAAPASPASPPPAPAVPGPQPQDIPAQPAAPAPQAPEEVLRGLLDRAQAGAPGLHMLLRRGGGRFAPLRELANSRRLDQARLEAAYFLETGLRYPRRPLPSAPSQPLEEGLRAQYLWEGAWGRACLSAAEALKPPELAQLCRELAGASALRGQAIRRLVERIWGGRT